MVVSLMRVVLSWLFVFVLASCAGVEPEPETKPDLRLEAASFKDLPGWGKDDMQTAMVALERSCTNILKRNPDSSFSTLPGAGTNIAWQGVCLDLKALSKDNQGAVQLFIERHFTPHQVLAGNNPEGLFTGYYEAALKGSKIQTARYNIPLHTRPDDLVMVQLGEFREELKGQRIAGRVVDGNLKPYETREQIVAGRWPHGDKVLVWVDDAVDAFFVQIQGSGLVQFEDGSTMRIGYAGQNGHIYYAIGRELVSRGELTKENVSMQSIRQWLAQHPDQADEIMNTNKSYVFFEETKGEGPVGGEGVPLTAGRSLAIDYSLLPYGAPLWLDIKEPALQRLMIAQDTGGAIRGPVRGDVFWGYGERAEQLAGSMKSPGQYWILLPK